MSLASSRQNRRNAVPCVLSALGIALALSFSAGCTTHHPHPYIKSKVPRRYIQEILPVVAVADFNDKSGFTGKWKITKDFADYFEHEMHVSEDFTIVERKNFGGMLNDMVLKGQQLFGKDKGKEGELTQARYLVHGTIVDFTVTDDETGWFSYSSMSSVLSHKARVSMLVRVTDLITGEIVTSFKAVGTDTSRAFWRDIGYKDLSFGSDSYFRTPLGDATEDAVLRAVDYMAKKLPVQVWEPRVAEAGVDMIIINGGKNVHMKMGDRFVVREKGRHVTDPVTGDRIETIAGRVVGKVEVTVVKANSSHAVITAGGARRGHYLEPTRD